MIHTPPYGGNVTKLSEFVAESLSELIIGVKEAQESAAELGALVNPSELRLTPRKEEKFELPVVKVAFDIAVTTLEGDTSKAGVAVLGGLLSVGGQTSAEAKETAASRIRFEIGVVLPKGSSG